MEYVWVCVYVCVYKLIHDGVLFSNKEWKYVILRKIGWSENLEVKQNQPESEKQISCVFTYMQNIILKKRHENRKESINRVCNGKEYYITYNMQEWKCYSKSKQN
jgi:hypothetical protein